MVQVFGETSKKHEKTHLLYIWLRGILQDHILRQRDQHKEGHKKCLGTRYFLNLFRIGCRVCRICRVWRVYYYMTTMTWYGSMIPCWGGQLFGWLGGLGSWKFSRRNESKTGRHQDWAWLSRTSGAPRTWEMSRMQYTKHINWYILYPYQSSYIDSLDRQTKKQAHWMRWTLYSTLMREITYARDRCVCPYEYMRNDKIRCERGVRTLKRTWCFDCFCQWIGRQILAETWHTWHIHTKINTYMRI